MFSSCPSGGDRIADLPDERANKGDRLAGQHGGGHQAVMIVPLTIALAIIAFAAAFHLHWALGGRTGYSVSLPQREDGTPVMAHRLPWWRLAAFGVAVALMALACLALSVTGWIDLPLRRSPQRLALGAVGAAFCLRLLLPNRYVGFFKSIRTTRWARFDTRLYSPLFLILGLSLIALAAG